MSPEDAQQYVHKLMQSNSAHVDVCSGRPRRGGWKNEDLVEAYVNLMAEDTPDDQDKRITSKRRELTLLCTEANC